MPAPDTEPLFGTPDQTRRLLGDSALLRQAIDELPKTRADVLLLLALFGSADFPHDEQPALEKVADEHFYQTALSTRRTLLANMAPGLTWLDGPEEVLAFHRGCFGCTVNFSEDPIPVIGPVLLASEPVIDGLLPPQAAVWTSGLPGVDHAAQYTVHEGR